MTLTMCVYFGDFNAKDIAMVAMSLESSNYFNSPVMPIDKPCDENFC
jgi:hypothetical protein